MSPVMQPRSKAVAVPEQTSQLQMSPQRSQKGELAREPTSFLEDIVVIVGNTCEAQELLDDATCAGDVDIRHDECC